MGGISGDFFAGVNFNFENGYSFSLFGYAGYLPTFNTTNSTTASTTTFTNGTGGALDFGGGIAFSLFNITTQSKGQLGIVVGTDVTGASNRYSYNGKPYIAAFIGSNF